jgi:hypothetical protein
MLLARVIFDFETLALETEFNLHYLFPSPLRGPISLILMQGKDFIFCGDHRQRLQNVRVFEL